MANDEAALTANIVSLASKYGRYGYRRITALLRADCEVNGYPLRKRDNVVLLLGAANRDPEVFEDPDRLDVGRDQGSHLSFAESVPRVLRRGTDSVYNCTLKV